MHANISVHIVLCGVMNIIDTLYFLRQKCSQWLSKARFPCGEKTTHIFRQMIPWSVICEVFEAEIHTNLQFGSSCWFVDWLKKCSGLPSPSSSRRHPIGGCTQRSWVREAGLLSLSGCPPEKAGLGSAQHLFS